MVIAGIWLVSVVLVSLPLLGWGTYTYLPNMSICVCDFRSSTSYTLFMSGLCFGVTGVFMCVCYAKIFRTVLASRKRVASASGQCKENSSVAPGVGSTVDTSEVDTRDSVSVSVQMGQHEQQKKQRMRYEELRLTASFLVIIFVYICTWLPFWVAILVSVFSEAWVARLPSVSALILGCASSCCNPFIYGLMNTKFRQSFKYLYCDVLCKPCMTHS